VLVTEEIAVGRLFGSEGEKLSGDEIEVIGRIHDN
jgi:hypothetical protein